MALKRRWNWREARPWTTRTKAIRAGTSWAPSEGSSSHWTLTLAFPARGNIIIINTLYDALNVLWEMQFMSALNAVLFLPIKKKKF